MPIELLAIGVLIAMFVFASTTPLNMGLLGFAAAWLVGTLVAGMPAKDISRILPADLMVTLLGVTYLFALAQANGAVGVLISRATRLVGGRAELLPWLMFLLAAVLTGIGALSPAAVAILAPLAMTFAARHGLNPLVSGLLIVHGAQAGGFSPLSVYGGITRDAAQSGGLAFDPMAPFLFSLALNLASAAILLRRRGEAPAAHPEETEPAAKAVQPAPLVLWATLGALLVLGVLTLAYELDIGFVAITLGLLLSVVSMPAQRQILAKLPWSEIVLILGVATYVGVLQRMGVMDRVGATVAAIGSPAVAALLILFVGAFVSAFASSAAVLGSLIPLAIPLLRDQPPTAAVLFVASLAVASTIVDVSPFSTNGALVLANAPARERQRLFRHLMIYGAVVTVAAPVVLWLVYVSLKS